MNAASPLSGLCRDCLTTFEIAEKIVRCPACSSPRIVAHAELHDLAIAHIDCDAFYAAIEKRDDPRLADQPVLIGGGRRGVVAAACYVARVYGIRSAMPMFKALEACPHAVVIPPNMAKYRAVGLQVRELMLAVTSAVEPLSIDEAFLDLRHARPRHGDSPARALARLALRIHKEIGVTVSIGLSYNKFLAKIASDLDKPRGFAVLGRGEARSFLAPRPVGLLWGVGKAMESRLRRDGIATIAQLQQVEEAQLVARYGSIGARLFRFARGDDDRQVTPDSEPRSISAETTFESDLTDPHALAARLRPLCDRVAASLRRKEVAAWGVTLKLKRSDFRQITRSLHLPAPTQRADTLYTAAVTLLNREADGRSAFRLIGVGAADLTNPDDADPPDLFDAPVDTPAAIPQQAGAGSGSTMSSLPSTEKSP
ncbi:MAG: DNA polymerase IV [Alphaproteobacteria bacterium]